MTSTKYSPVSVRDGFFVWNDRRSGYCFVTDTQKATGAKWNDPSVKFVERKHDLRVDIYGAVGVTKTDANPFTSF